MKKNKRNSITKWLITTLLCLSLVLGTGIFAAAEEAETDVGYSETTEADDSQFESESDEKKPENSDFGTENGTTVAENPDKTDFTPNVFDQLYKQMEANADKIFSVLAFLGTIAVGIAYKSNLIPLLREALTRLKGSIDTVKEENDKNNLENSGKLEHILTSMAEINQSLAENSQQIARIKWEFESYNDLLREREAMKTLLEGQIDLLYSIFMSSDLPQYQKDEIGEKIHSMREELLAYESKKN